jgi:hypothetical protein
MKKLDNGNDNGITSQAVILITAIAVWMIPHCRPPITAIYVVEKSS